ncbi:MAG: crossover junction endodeoxyribonuclease RuvC [Pseudomonadota bacterium]
MSIILGIDPGSRITGYGVVQSESGRQTYIDCGCIRLGDVPLADRLLVLFDSLNQVIAQHQPDIMSVEQVFLAKNASSALVLGHARGVAMLAGTHNGLDVHEYSAKQIKRAVVGTGAAQKSQVQHMVTLLLSLSGKPKEDAADALAAALCHSRLAPSATLLGKELNKGSVNLRRRRAH